MFWNHTRTEGTQSAQCWFQCYVHLSNKRQTSFLFPKFSLDHIHIVKYWTGIWIWFIFWSSDFQDTSIPTMFFSKSVLQILCGLWSLLNNFHLLWFYFSLNLDRYSKIFKVFAQVRPCTSLDTFKTIEMDTDIFFKNCEFQYGGSTLVDLSNSCYAWHHFGA